jgi:hypothetical protein
MVTGIFPLASLYSVSSSQDWNNEDMVIEKALYYLRNSPTFKFDGIPESIEVRNTSKGETDAEPWLITIYFECLHSGYGERTGDMLLQVVTPHTIDIEIIKCKVTSAVMDGRWDVMNQEFISPDYTEEEAIDISLEFLRSSPTFKFDGIPESIEIVNVEPLRMPYTWQVTMDFQSRHPGYGNRLGMILAQVITPHRVKIIVSENKVISGVIDDSWDIIKQREIIQSELLPPEIAIEIAIMYIEENHEEIQSLGIPIWENEEIIGTGQLGSQKIRYTAEEWNVTVTHPVVQNPVYDITIEYYGEPNFIWEGTVDQQSQVTESSFKIV